jgi:riboflavin kinase/FMN adenylyltransferase
MFLIEGEEFHNSLNQYPVVTIGNFDGVHRGHRKILEQGLKKARTHNGHLIVLTFFPHPEQILFPEKAPKLLCSNEEKAFLMSQLEVDALWVIPFSKALAALTAEKFLLDYVIHPIHPKEIVLGHDHRFGKQTDGKAETVKEICDRFSIVTDMVEPVMTQGERISSTKIRQLLNLGNIQEANLLLGHPYMIAGTVVKGEGRGKQLGFPTINIQLPVREKQLFPDGVYQVGVKAKEKNYLGALYVGERPTFNKKEKTIEIHILNFKDDLYGQNVLIYMNRKIRDDQKFKNAEDLINQIQIDIKSIQNNSNGGNVWD